MNRHFIIGNLTRDPETGTTTSGVNYCTFTVAVNRQKKADGTQEADFMRVTAWRALADTCAKYLKKGRKVAVLGESRAHGWLSRDGGEPRAQIEIDARDVEFLTPAGGGGQQEPVPPAWAENAPAAEAAPERTEQVGYTEAMAAPGGFTAVETDDLPF